MPQHQVTGVTFLTLHKLSDRRLGGEHRVVVETTIITSQAGRGCDIYWSCDSLRGAGRALGRNSSHQAKKLQGKQAVGRTAVASGRG